MNTASLYANNTFLIDAISGKKFSVRELSETDQNINVHFLESGAIMECPLGKVKANGKPFLLEMRTATGKLITATGDCQFLTSNGWKSIETIEVGTKIATPAVLQVKTDYTRKGIGELAKIARKSKTVPTEAFALRDEDVKLFLNKLADELTSSEMPDSRLARDVQLLLLRLGVVAKIEGKKPNFIVRAIPCDSKVYWDEIIGKRNWNFTGSVESCLVECQENFAANGIFIKT